ncbi:DNA polymerase zeta [Actinomortierella ambigua]|uniref:DNA polymerase n=1 Tax=Actinomortierella ambigua TaxID=1343610 RepID=A0A9P6UDB7_9FUNG|nr:DNA polymerase zeta [Actinomortierella ambigua]
MSGGLNSSSEGMHGTPSKRSSLFKVRIADIDHYMAAPGPLDLAFCQFLPPKVPVAKVPVLRVFGANEAGQKCCLHIHRAYPYFYVPYEGELDETTLNTFIHTLGLSLNRATTLSYGGDPNNVRKSQYVAAIIPVKGVPFYGYHVGYANFLKIYLFNPDNETRIVDLMRGGAVMNRSFQPFEAHIPFRLQFCIDFNLYGMGWVEMESALFRNDVPHSYEGEHPKRWTIDNVVDENIWAVDKGQTKISNCEVELDTTIDQIINRDRAPERNTHHTLEECFKAPLTQAQVPSVAGLWEDDAIRRRAKGLPSQEPPKTQAREKEAMPWHNHDRALAMVAELVHEVMLQENASTPPTFESFIVKENPETRPWMTAYEAVNALCPQPVAEGGMGNADPSEVLFDEGDSSIIINEDVISQAVGASEVRTNAKQTRDGVRGMDDIEADDDDHELFGLLGDEFVGLDEDDLLNVVDQWEDLAATSDTDVASHVPGVVRPPTERPHKDYPSSVAPRSLQIPQYDGSGDHDDEDDDFVADSELPDMRKRKHQTSAEAEWRSHMRSSGSKRSKSRQPLISPSSTTSSSTRSWSQGNESNGRTRPDISSTSQHTLTSRASQPPSSTSRLGSQASVPRSLPFSSLHSRLSPARVLSSLGSTVANTPSPASHMRPLPAVEIPISASKSSAATLRQIMPRSRFLVNDEDDPIIDDDDSLENIFANDEFCAMDEPQVAGQHQAQSFEHSSRYEPQLQEKPTSHEQGSKLDFPAPASPHHQYFMSTLSEMWSSPSPSPPKLSFFNAPPRAFSPSAIQEVSSLPGPAGTAEPMLVDDQATKDLSGLDKTESQKSAPEHTASQPAESDTSSVFTSPNRSKRSRRVSWHPSPDVVYTFAAEPPQDEIQAGALLSSVVEETFIAEDSDDEGSDSRRSVNLKDIQLEDTFKASAHEQSELSSKSSRSSSSTSSRHRGSVVLAEDSFEANKSDEILLPSSLFSSSPRWSMALPTCHSYQFNIPAPTASGLLSTLDDHHLPHIVHQKPFFSNAADLPPRSKTFGGKEFRLESHDLAFTRRFVGGHNTLLSSTSDGADKTTFTTSLLPPRGTKFWEPVQPPPTYAAMTAWLASEEAEKRKKRSSVFAPSTQQQREKISQLEAPTPKNPYGYKNSPTKVAGSAAIEKDHMDLFSMEVMCHTRGELLPDPKQDMILAIFYCWQTEREEFVSNGWEPGFRIGMITHEEASFGTKMGLSGLGENSVKVTQNEREMIEEAMRLVRDLDPDILVGYEIHNASWGYLVDRYQALAGADLAKMISRIHYHTVPTLTKRALEERNSYNSKHSSGIKIIGRHMFNVWRLIRSEVALTNYGFSNVIFHVLQQRIPSYSHRTLTTWWTDGSPLHQSRVIRHYLSMVQYSLQLIEVQELVSRTSEFARVFGIDFFSVISRGSQYKVESLMVRLAKPENYIMISPSRQQVGSQRAAECLPMIMEPESAFYEDPVAVLDFQSLYPSVMIAYNYCYSTCLGKLGGGSKLGVTEYRPQPGILPLVKDHLHVAPNNVMYVNQEIRRGLLGRMLTEILETRVMVKKAMKDQPDDKSLLKLLQARQMGLKFLANVTYGYTCASFSGRMPGIEIADSIVHSARETLERAIQFVGENPKWKARVVYGDTDSMFVHLPGRTREEAFEIAYDIAETITRMNPRPVKLKFEKIYHGCFLVTKKRYVGASYEYPGQVEPIFDAKGIETIRRDGVPAVQKIMETCIK